MKRTTTAILLAAIFISLLAPCALAEGSFMPVLPSGSTVLAINSNIAPTSGLGASPEIYASSAEEPVFMALFSAGEECVPVDLTLPDPEPINLNENELIADGLEGELSEYELLPGETAGEEPETSLDEEAAAEEAEPADNTVIGDTRTIISSASDNKRFTVSMELLYEGTHCTVWGSTSDDEDIRISAENAAAIAGEFDSKFETILSSFGGYWYDTDKDGKLAIMCYDCDADRANGRTSFPNGYVGGYFWSSDLIGENDKILDIEYVPGAHKNCMDCIHIDTYPGMGGNGKEMTDVSHSFSTLYHEFQHLMEYSYRVKDGRSGYYGTGPTYMNEAFSMAAEFLMCGYDAVKARVSYFNGASYQRGTSLLAWNKDLTSYASAFLLGQYLRTRYAALTGTDGSSFFNAMLTSYNSKNYSDPLAVAAGLLGTTSRELIEGFWIACKLKQTKGAYGFNGESWANNIKPRMSDWSTTVYNTGACYYSTTGSAALTATGGLDMFSLTADSVKQIGGSCGMDAEWILDGTVLQISGTGEISASAASLWGTDVTAVYIGEGITGIGSGAFALCASLGRVILPSTIEAVAADAFTGCTALTDFFTAADSATWAASAGLAGAWHFDHTHTFGEAVEVIADTTGTLGLSMHYCTDCGAGEALPKPGAAVSITLDGNGGIIGTKSIEGNYKREIGAIPEPTRVGYIFLGWFTEKDGGTEYASGVTVDTYTPFTLYARWQKNCTPGDVNGDGEIDVVDLLVMKKYFVGVVSSAIPDNCDTDGDGALSAADLLRFKKYFIFSNITIG